MYDLYISETHLPDITCVVFLLFLKKSAIKNSRLAKS